MTSFSDPFANFGSTGLGYNGFEVSLNYLTGVPDVNMLTDPNVKIIFKSLLKRDDTTKEKLLVDLLKLISDESQAYVLEDQLVISAWVQLYPKLAIDVSKNVRINLHQVQSSFVKSVGKRYAKYLKDTAPVWLAGIFDSERLVSRSVTTSLTNAFQSQEKVDLLWKLFTEQTLNFCYQVIKFETKDTLSDERNVGKDEAQAKYIRVLFSAISVLTKIATSEDITGEKGDFFSKIINLKELWELTTTNDLHLKKAILMLVVTLVKTHPELIDDSLLKTISKAVIKSLKYKSATNNIIYSIIALPTLSCILNLSNFNIDFWELGGKKSKEKFLAFLELGSCSSSEIYYDLLTSIFKKIPDYIIDWSSEQDFETLTSILVHDVDQERLIPFKNRAWSCFFAVQSQFYGKQPEIVNAKLSDITRDHLNKNLSKDIIKSIVIFYQTIGSLEFLQNTIDTIIKALPNGKIDTKLIENTIDVLCAADFKLANDLFDKSFSSLEDIGDDGSDYNPPLASFTVFNKILSLNVVQFKDQITQFLEHALASFVEENFIEEPLALLIAYNNNKDFLEGGILNDAFNMVFNKLLLIDEKLTKVALAKLPKLTNVDVDSCPDVKSFIVGKSENFDVKSSDHSLIFNFLTKDVFINMFNKSVETQSEDTFISQFLTKFDKFVLTEFVQSGDASVQLFFNYLFLSIENPDSSKLLSAIDQNEDEIFISAIMAYISRPQVATIDPLLTFLKTERPTVVEKILASANVDDFKLRIKSSIGDSVDLRLSIANPLEGNILMSFDNIHSSFDKTKTLALILYSKMILELVRGTLNNDVEIFACLALVGEIAMDYYFLFNAEDEKLMEFHSESALFLKESVTGFKLSDFVEVVYGDKNGSALLDFLKAMTEGNSSLSFYFNRVLKSLLTDLVENESMQSFDKLEFNLNQLLKSPLRFSTFIISCKKFLTSTKFERARNVVASELIGLKTDQILTKGLTNLSLLNDFLLCDSLSYQVETFVPIPEQRFNMVVRDLNNWLESDIAYDDEFILIRIQLLCFVNNFIALANSSQAIDVERVLQLGFSLFRDCIGIVAAEQTNESLDEVIVPLRYFALRLFIILNKRKDEIEAWDEDIEGVYEELTDSLLNLPNTSLNDQPSKMINELYYRIFESLIPIKYLNLEDFYKSLNYSGELQRLGVCVLDRLILLQQQDYVIEYELNRSKVSSDDMSDDTSNLAKIPEFLVQAISQVPEEYLEYENVAKMNKYLWGWYLIFDHFKDITQRMREDYIKQLRPEFDVLLKFIFHQIDLNSDIELIKRLSASGEISHYDLSVSSAYDSHVEEQKHLIIHLCYMSFDNVGSLVQSWFNTIRDRQLKLAIEKFAINYISPLLIDNELNKASKFITDGSSSTINDENLTIKINRATHEIKSLYLIDERTMEMVIKIPNSYPLLSVTVDGPVRLGVKESQWKSWLLASQRIITSQHSTIVGAIELFNKNVSLHFSGFEECAICYSILHYLENTLPSKTCTTCNNKFHAGCLYKWFKSSGGSTCPLCRSTFNFRK